MTPAGTFELPLMIVQVFVALGAAWAGIRLVDDIKSFLVWRTARNEREIR